MMTYVLIWFVLGALVLAYYATQDDEGWRRAVWTVVIWLVAPGVALMDVLRYVRDRLDSRVQILTFWYYVFDRKRLLAEERVLKDFHDFTLQHRGSGSVRDRLWRMSFRLVMKANDFTPPHSRGAASQHLTTTKTQTP